MDGVLLENASVVRKLPLLCGGGTSRQDFQFVECVYVADRRWMEWVWLDETVYAANPSV
jgi:hypothetical protein